MAIIWRSSCHLPKFKYTQILFLQYRNYHDYSGFVSQQSNLSLLSKSASPVVSLPCIYNCFPLSAAQPTANKFYRNTSAAHGSKNGPLRRYIELTCNKGNNAKDAIKFDERQKKLAEKLQKLYEEFTPVASQDQKDESAQNETFFSKVRFVSR